MSLSVLKIEALDFKGDVIGLGGLARTEGRGAGDTIIHYLSKTKQNSFSELFPAHF